MANLYYVPTVMYQKYSFNFPLGISGIALILKNTQLGEHIEEHFSKPILLIIFCDLCNIQNL